MSGKPFSARFPGLAVLLAVTIAGGVLVVMTATAAEPGSGSVDLGTRMINWKGESFQNENSVGSGYGQASRCLASEDVPGCDRFGLTVDIDAGHWDENTGGVEITILPDAPAAGEPEDNNDNFDIYVYEGGGTNPVPVDQSTTAGETAERILVPNASGEYTIVVQARNVTASGYQGGVRVESRPNEGGDVPQEPLSNQPCVNGKSAGIFPCEGFDLASFLPREDLGSGGSEPPASPGSRRNPRSRSEPAGPPL